ncbi:bifunctional phosphopantothenoylcysteine decarboxylase/phosphopantothenate--cysteine ligase CoaBC [candidate division TA06 bacterium]|uniref:Coenzyme A biosynthesis bifunctional protein CoaBC n=1 Tax=candidate division TA06 bacterium TaxID=2250710 RepID=A0A933I9L8_UNCT6|nr:bifunctional phosphopantothenoylcysteine decarboxylase/phosphopantothenate--cysteine ligase CoaBC [candidate division TA06 bacterium]
MSSGKKILLGVTGSIAAYKALDLASRLRKKGHQVTAVMTKSACQLVGPASFESLTGNPVALELFPKQKPQQIEHISLAQWADLVLIAPATANFLGKAANGIADDLLTTVALAATVPILIAPAMNVNMWQSRAVQENLKKLKSFGWKIIEPESGRLACGDIGKGRLASLETIEKAIQEALYPSRQLAGIPVLITAGRTEEDIDPVRTITNRSSGRMGYALAAEAEARGARVTLITGPADINPPQVHHLVKVKTVEQMSQAVKKHLPLNRALVMTAAVADFKPSKTSVQKIKRGPGTLNLKLEPVSDILAQASKNNKKHALLIGFALESQDLLANARKKLISKNLDLIVANGPKTIASGKIQATLLEPKGRAVKLSLMGKSKLAGIILDKLDELLKKREENPNAR